MILALLRAADELIINYFQAHIHTWLHFIHCLIRGAAFIIRQNSPRRARRTRVLLLVSHTIKSGWLPLPLVLVSLLSFLCEATNALLPAPSSTL